MGKWIKEWHDGEAVEQNEEKISDALLQYYKEPSVIMASLKAGKMSCASMPRCVIYYKPNAYEAEVNQIKTALEEFMIHADGKGELHDMLSAKIQMDKIVEHVETLAQIFNEGR